MNDVNNATVMANGLDLTLRIVENLRQKGTIVQMHRDEVAKVAAEVFKDNVGRLVK